MRDGRKAARSRGSAFDGKEVRVRTAAFAHRDGRVKHNLDALKVHEQSDLVRSEGHDGPRARRELSVKDPAVVPAHVPVSVARAHEVQTVNAQALDSLLL